MRHLNEEELIDLAEGTRAEASAPHLQSCESCRRQLRELRAVMSEAAAVDVPAPSPPFWDHFSARVRESIAQEPAPSTGWSWWLVPAGAFAAVALAIVTAVGVNSSRPATTPSNAVPAVAESVDPVSLSD